MNKSSKDSSTRPEEIKLEPPSVPANPEAAIARLAEDRQREHTGAAAVAPSTPAHPKASWAKWILAAGLALGPVAAAFWLAPLVRTALTTVSTDDAYVNGHVTFVAPRVAGQVARVLVDDNARVKAGDVLVELDPEPF